MINKYKTNIEGLFLLEPQFISDERGYFYESFNQLEFENIIGNNISFVQDNHSHSSEGVLRGLHFQVSPKSQGKLVRVVSGEIYDVAVDLRKKSSTYGKYCAVILSAENRKQFWIPEGFAHGFLSLTDNTEVIYKVTDYYSPEHERTIIYNDPFININWPEGNKILSKKDMLGIKFRELNDNDFF